MSEKGREGAAKSKVTGGICETEKESCVLSQKELSGCKLRSCFCNSVNVCSAVDVRARCVFVRACRLEVVAQSQPSAPH